MSGKAGSPRAQAKLKELERRKQLRQDGDLQHLMSSQQGRRFVWRWMDGVCGLTSLSFSGDRQTTDFKEGRRAVGVQLAAEIQRVCPERYVEMLGEQLQLQQEDRAFREDAEADVESE